MSNKICTYYKNILKYYIIGGLGFLVLYYLKLISRETFSICEYATIVGFIGMSINYLLYKNKIKKR